MNLSTFLLKSTKNKSFGTAFCIDKNQNGSFLVSCQHVISSCGKEHLEVNGLKAELQVSFSQNELIDLAVIYVKGLEAKPLKLSLATLSDDARFSMDGFKPYKSSGEYKQEKLEGSIKKVSQIHDGIEHIDVYELYIGEGDKIEKGYSGSAIVSKKSGQVVAVATARVTSGKEAYAIPLKYLKEIWDELNPKLFDTVTPFMGLSPFGRVDRAYFFGRDREINEISTQIKIDSMMAVIGDSGSGKSSLIKAGVIPKILKEYYVLETRPAQNPFFELARVVAKVCETRNYSEMEIGYFIDKIKTEKPQAIHAVFERLFQEDEAKLLLYIDQFEELFTLCNEPLQKAFMETLLFLVNAPSYFTIKIIFTMRRDYYNLLASHQPFNEKIQDATYLVRRMKDENLQEVIEKPLELLDVEKSVIKKLSSVILADMGDESKEITLLQIALTQTWERKAESNHDLLASYVHIGKVTGALSILATDTLRSLSNKEQELFKYIFIRMVKFSDIGGITRRLASRDEFSDETWKLVQKLASVYDNKEEKNKSLGRLLKLQSRKEKGREEFTELIHEALVTQWSTYVNWLREINKDNQKRIHDALIDLSKAYKKDPKKKYLLKGYTLEESTKLLGKRYRKFLSFDEQTFIEASQKREKRIKLLIGGVVSFLVILLVLSWFLFVQTEHEKKKSMELTKKLVSVVKNYGDIGIERHIKNNPNSSKIYNFIISNFKNSKSSEILYIVRNAYLGMGFIHTEKKDYKKAISSYKKAIKIKPLAEAYINIGVIHIKRDEYKDAMKAYEDAIDLNSNSVKAYSSLGLLLVKNQEYRGAIECYKNLVKLNSANDQDYFYMGLSYTQISQYNEAIKSYQNSIDINNTNDRAYHKIANLYLIQQQYDKAMFFFKGAIEINFRNEEAHLYMGTFSFHKKEYDKAIKSYQNVIKINPENYEVYITMGEIYTKKNAYMSAIEMYKEALKLNSNNSALYINLLELQLVTNQFFDKKIQIEYIKRFKGSSKSYIVYEMLLVFQNIVEERKENLGKWKIKYNNVSLGFWDWQILENWIETIVDMEKKARLENALKFFKAHKSK